MGLNTLDFAVIVAYLVAITLFGLRFRRHRADLKDYFLAGNSVPWWAISLSIVAAVTQGWDDGVIIPTRASQHDRRYGGPQAQSDLGATRSSHLGKAEP